MRHSPLCPDGTGEKYHITETSLVWLHSYFCPFVVIVYIHIGIDTTYYFYFNNKNLFDLEFLNLLIINYKVFVTGPEKDNIYVH